MGGYIAMALFLSLVLVLVTRLRLGRSQSDYRLGMFVLLLLGVFLSNQVKVEFIRLGNYVIFIGAFFASLGLLLSKMTDSDESKLEKVQ
jgi:low temperature requirement protein LtrA